MATCCIFPAEIISYILRSSSPRDVVRWRSVSKWFRAITYDVSIWRYLYASSSLPRPPGSFPFQPATHLEQSLVRSEKLTRSWTTGPMRDVSHVELRIEQQPSRTIKLLGGRWIVGCESARLFVLHDVDASAEKGTPQKQLIWEQDEPVHSWDVSSIMMDDGRFAMYVLLSEKQLGVMTWRLVEVLLDVESGEPCGIASFEVPTTEFEAEFIQGYIEGGQSPFLYIPDRMVFDTRTHMFYEFPEFRIALGEIEDEADDSQEPAFVVLTRTYVIAIYETFAFGDNMTLIQAFTVGEPSVGNGVQRLRLSHEALSDYLYQTVTLLQDTNVDPVTRSTKVKLLDDDPLIEDCFTFQELTLPEPCGDDVLPIAVPYWNAEKPPGYKIGDFICATYPDAGYLRGLYQTDCADLHCPIVKFAIDATQDEIIITFGEPLFPEWKDVKDPGSGAGIGLDSARGRLYFVQPMENRYSQVTVIDLE